jgi:hypothetical protein
MTKTTLSTAHKHHCLCSHKPLALVRESPYRLPRNVLPKHYDLTIDCDPDDDTFKGNVAIDVQVVAAVTQVKVNALNLLLENIVLEHADGTRIDATASYDDKTEIATLTLASEAAAGAWQLKASFSGSVNEECAGLFHAAKTGKDGVTHNLLCTQFEAAEARRVFPCFDEPDLKATFKLSLILPRYYMALANGNGVYSEALAANRKLVVFEETGVMSTYLLAFAIGPIVCSDPATAGNTEIRVWSLPGHEEESAFALETARFGLEYFEKYFEIAYPHGRKLDLVAVPGFTWGGMENIGLVVCGENVLLNKNGSGGHRAQVNANIIMHELAHQWFGDYVTMRWWNGLWLNESFATFMATKACQAFFPKVDQWLAFCDGREKAYNADCLKNTHPIEETVENARDAIFLVDAISYEKGCSVLYSFEQFLGEEVFRQGIATYLKRHAFANTEASDLWDALEDACKNNKVDVPIRSVMDTWIRQSGFPEILVEQGRKPGTVKLTQAPFRLLDKGRKTGRLWPIPVKYAFSCAGTSEERKALLTRKVTVLSLAEGGENIDWVKVNAGGSGFYRLRYSKDLLAKLTADVDNILSEVERRNLLADAGAYHEACMMPSSDVYLMVQALLASSAEPDYGTYAPFLTGLYGLLDEVGRKRFRKHLAGELKKSATASGAWARAEVEPLPFVKHWQLFNLNLSPMIQKASLLMNAAWQKDSAAVDAMDAALTGMILSFGPKKLQALVPKELADQRLKARPASALQLQAYLMRLAELAADTGKKLDVFELFASAILDHSLKSNNGPAELVYSNWLSWTGQKAKGDDEHPIVDPDPDKRLPEIAISQNLRRIMSVDNAEDERQMRELFSKYPYPLVQKEVDKCLERIRASVLVRERESVVFSGQIAALLKKKAA